MGLDRKGEELSPVQKLAYTANTLLSTLSVDPQLKANLTTKKVQMFTDHPINQPDHHSPAEPQYDDPKGSL